MYRQYILGEDKYVELEIRCRQKDATVVIRRRLASSGKGELISPDRRPASRCTTLTRRLKPAIAAAIAVVVSP